MSNFKNIFGNEGWIQSSIDRSRGKTRPGEKRRKGVASDKARRKQTLLDDPLFQKYGNPEDLETMDYIGDPNKKPKGLAGLLGQALAKQQPKKPPRGVV